MAPKDALSIDYSKSNLLSPIEVQILTQYQLLASQLHTLSEEIKQLNVSNSHAKSVNRNTNEPELTGSATQLLDNLRNLEMKISLIYTLFKGAVYSLFLDNEQDNLNDLPVESDSERFEKNEYEVVGDVPKPTEESLETDYNL